MNRQENKQTRELSITGLKGVCCCLIAFFWHYQTLIDYEIPDVPVFKLFPLTCSHSWLATDVFFVLSGLGITLGYKDKIYNHNIRFFDYMKKRIGSVYPLHIFTMIVIGILQHFYMANNGFYLAHYEYDEFHLLLNILLVQNGLLGVEQSFNGPAWFLSIVLGMYILFYLITYISGKLKTTLFYKSMMVLFIISGSVIYYNYLAYPIFNHFTARGLISFSIGMLIAEYYKSTNRKHSDIVGIIGLIIAVAFYFYTYTNIKTEYFPLKETLVFFLIVSPSIVLTALFFTPIKKLLSTKVFLYLGDISMYIYLVHMPLQVGLSLLFKNSDVFKSFIMYFVYLALTIVLAELTKRAQKLIASKLRKTTNKCTMPQ